MSKLDNISAFFSKTGQTLASVAKIVLLSRAGKVHSIGEEKEIVILGNGPSLNQTISESPNFLHSKKKLAVNFAANTPVFFNLKPDLYVLADPHFFNSDAENVKNLWENFAKVDWHMTLYIPHKTKGATISKVMQNNNISIERYNLTPIEGFRPFCRLAFKHGWGMPRPRNVLIPSIMLAIAAGFKEIYVAGADHSWMKTISVDDNNCVVSVQPHFYKDSAGEQTRVNTEYMKYPLHQIIYSFYVAFKSYFEIKDYADSVGTTIWNITPGSFIDAFPRKKLPFEKL